MGNPLNAELEDFFKPVVEDTRITVIDKTALSPGVLLVYRGSKEVATKRGARDTNIMHEFQTVDVDESRTFAVWGSGQINNKLAKVSRGSLVFVSYLGKRTPDDSFGVAVHAWEVNNATRPLDKIPEEFRAPLRPLSMALARAIDAAQMEAAKKFADRVAAGQSGANDDEYLNSFEHYQ